MTHHQWSFLNVETFFFLFWLHEQVSKQMEERKHNIFALSRRLHRYVVIFMDFCPIFIYFQWYRCEIIENVVLPQLVQFLQERNPDSLIDWIERASLIWQRISPQLSTISFSLRKLKQAMLSVILQAILFPLRTWDIKSNSSTRLGSYLRCSKPIQP